MVHTSNHYCFHPPPRTPMAHPERGLGNHRFFARMTPAYCDCFYGKPPFHCCAYCYLNPPATTAPARLPYKRIIPTTRWNSSRNPPCNVFHSCRLKYHQENTLIVNALLELQEEQAFTTGIEYKRILFDGRNRKTTQTISTKTGMSGFLLCARNHVKNCPLRPDRCKGSRRGNSQRLTSSIPPCHCIVVLCRILQFKPSFPR